MRVTRLSQGKGSHGTSGYGAGLPRAIHQVFAFSRRALERMINCNDNSSACEAVYIYIYIYSPYFMSGM